MPPTGRSAHLRSGLTNHLLRRSPAPSNVEYARSGGSGAGPTPSLGTGPSLRSSTWRQRTPRRRAYCLQYTGTLPPSAPKLGRSDLDREPVRYLAQETSTYRRAQKVHDHGEGLSSPAGIMRRSMIEETHRSTGDSTAAWSRPSLGWRPLARALPPRTPRATIGDPPPPLPGKRQEILRTGRAETSRQSRCFSERQRTPWGYRRDRR